jgi:hypothetical protein
MVQIADDLLDLDKVRVGFPSDGMDGSPAHRRRWVVGAKEG